LIFDWRMLNAGNGTWSAAASDTAKRAATQHKVMYVSQMAQKRAPTPSERRDANSSLNRISPTKPKHPELSHADKVNQGLEDCDAAFLSISTGDITK
jgi:hypothetical protein